MSVTVGAALKKIAVALLSDKKTLKKAAMAILVVIVGGQCALSVCGHLQLCLSHHQE